MTLLGVVGILLALSAFYFGGAGASRQKMVVFSLLFLLHTAASTAYYFYALSFGADAAMYYNDPYGIYGNYWLMGTVFVVHLVQYIKETIGGTFYDHFMLFQAVGFWGIIFIVKIFDEIFEELEVPQPIYMTLVLFLPGLHFWTGAIGKDAPLFLAVALTVWASMRLGKRFPVFAIAVAIMLLFRPHIALLALGAITLSVLIDRRTKLWIKGGILTAIFMGIGTVIAGVETAFMLDLTNTESVNEFLSKEVTVESGADLEITNASFTGKLIGLLFRPFFFDVSDPMGYIASAENAVLLFMFGFLFWNIGLAAKLFFKIQYVRFSIIFFVALTILLTLVNFNIGLGLRQKMMFMPCFLAIIATLVAVRVARRPGSEARQVPAYHPVTLHAAQPLR